jgi:hypothetical protein
LVIEKLRAWPSGSDAVGRNEYACPTVPLLGGVPLIVGARFAAVTVTLKGASVAEAVPSDTEMTMLLKVAVVPAEGVPARRPVATSKLAQDG